MRRPGEGRRDDDEVRSVEDVGTTSYPQGGGMGEGPISRNSYEPHRRKCGCAGGGIQLSWRNFQFRLISITRGGDHTENLEHGSPWVDGCGQY
ncbi:hypothetical protein EBT25_08190 [bacterium]|nr:hypothetical protein [bacterium]